MTRNSHCADLVRRLDPDRYVTALFAADDRRDDLFTLYAFNAEVARIRESVTEPTLGRIRLQWWRDTVAESYDGKSREHFVAAPLAATIRRHGLSRELFDRLLEARERDLDERPLVPLAELKRYARDSSGSLVRLALELLGAREEAVQSAGDRVGTAWALTGMMRALPHRVGLGQPVLPLDLMHEKGLADSQPVDLRSSPELSKVVEEIAASACQNIEKARESSGNVERKAVPAVLLAPLVQAYLKRLAATGFDPFDARNAAPLRFRAWRLIPRAVAGRY